ncbi:MULTISPECIES: phosphoribosyltransferase [unclassified Duganella]|jgi:hypothetical protein|uniref:phosphoribosyltransferase n=1 Tax=unclassified Duganella TaxID=2636909 RepID=UPI00088FF148|nr:MULTISPECIES: phosphoribosyltransferase [unclassified Duganella]SDG70876.1 hypothetical protein SAMN05216320_106250 [Duganella sp. OV458]SDJ96487.1 hypothetical protein SAMN05428973_107251 [Duganella sp. OV510]
MNHPPRFPWNRFPPVYIHAPERFVRNNPAFLAASNGDILAAVELVAEAISPRLLAQLWQRFDPLAPVLVSPQSLEMVGLSVIPQMTASLISNFLAWPCEVRVTCRRSSGTTGYELLQQQTIFDGPVVIGLNYLLIDEFIDHGGTLANFRGHILNQKGYVIGATVLAGDNGYADLAVSNKALGELRSRHGHIEYWWRQRFGFGFESLTASEARYLSRARSSENIIASLEAIAR